MQKLVIQKMAPYFTPCFTSRTHALWWAKRKSPAADRFLRNTLRNSFKVEAKQKMPQHPFGNESAPEAMGAISLRKIFQPQHLGCQLDQP
jgi:hypothetical protein